MPNIGAALVKLVQRLTARASRGVIMYGTREFSVAAVREIDITVRGVRIAYKNLAPEDQKAVDEVVKYVVRFTDQYVQHTEEYKKQREEYRRKFQRELTFEEYLDGHADEIVDAAMRAAIAQGRSALYDRTVGKPKFENEIWAKEYVNALIDDVCSRIR